MKQLPSRRALISVSAIIVISLVAVMLLASYESRESKIHRLNSVAQTLPEFNGRQITPSQKVDGECKELTNSSALPVLVDRHKISEETYVQVRQQFIDETKQNGITWHESTIQPTALFERNGKTYKLATYKSSHSDGDYYNISLTACN